MADKSPKKPAAADAALPAVADVEVPDAAPAVDTSSTEATEPAAEHVPVSESSKLAFAAALERKKQAGQARSAHLDGHSGVGGATSSHKATRTFRRKSGAS